MSAVVAYLVRFATIIVGYAVAALAASAFLNVVMLAALGFIAGETSMAAANSLVFSIPFVALFVAYFAFIPSAFAILAAELFSKRDWLFHALAGAAVALIVIGFGRGAGEIGHGDVADTNFMLAVIGSGMCGGVGYWLVAGRGAGSWRTATREKLTSPAP